MNRGKQRFLATPQSFFSRLRIAVPAVFALIAAFAVQAEEPGREAFVAGDYAKALEIWRPMAEEGDARAQFNVGLIYDEGLGVERDREKAREWWSMAAEQGLLTAGYNLALLEIEQATDEDGGGDIEQALANLRETAEAGHLPARYTLGKIYQYGVGVAEDPAAAVEHIRAAAEGGFAKAQYSLGKIYRDGSGVEQDAAQAAEWFGQAARRGHAGAQDHYARRLASGEGVDKDPVRAMTFAVLAMRAGVEDAAALAEEIRKELTIAELDDAFRAADGFEALAGTPAGEE